MHVLTFSRKFPAYHPKAGRPTYFVEKLWQSIYMEQFEQCTRAQFDFSPLYGAGIDIYAHDKYQPKHHTIRAGHRFKPGDWFSPRVWSGQPYRSKQIIIAPPIQVKKVWDFEIQKTDHPSGAGDIVVNGSAMIRLNDIAVNDGLSVADLLSWFKYPKPFTGQIICWNEKIEY